MNQKQNSNGKIILIFSLCCIGVLILSVAGMFAYKFYLEKPVETVSTTEPEEVLPEEPEEEESPYREQLTSLIGNGEDTVTVMFYFNGSNLESDYGSATDDIEEMLEAPYNPNVNLVIQTTGTLEWQQFGIASDHDQRYLVQEDDLLLVDDSLELLDCTSSETLLDFLLWSKENYPADRYIFVFWNHGGGSVEGFGYNEWGPPSYSLSIAEMQDAFEQSGMVFDFIGMDCCIMSSIEVCYALYDYCDYMILSEDFESALGWSYADWLTQLAGNSSVSTELLARTIIDDMVEDNDTNYHSGSSSTLALIDQRYIPELFEAWKTFAYANEETLLASNFSREVNRSGRALPYKVASDLEGYYITDMMALAMSISSSQSKQLASCINNAISYYNCTDDNVGLTGLAVTLPYGSRSFYNKLTDVFLACGLDKQYVLWLDAFTGVTGEVNYYDYDDFEAEWGGWEAYEEEEN